MKSWLRGCWSLGFPLVDTELGDAQAAHAHLHHYLPKAICQGVTKMYFCPSPKLGDVGFTQGGGVSGGYRKLFRFELPASYHLNLGIFLAFSEFCCQKKNPTQVKSLFENTIENPFFDFFKILTKTLLKKIQIRNIDSLILNLLSESVFDFGKWSN